MNLEARLLHPDAFMKTILTIILITSATYTFAGERMRPIFFILSSTLPDVEKLINSANKEYLKSQVSAIRKAIKNDAPLYESMRRELGEYERLLSSAQDGDPLPSWVENIIIIERQKDWLVAYYPRDSGIVMNQEGSGIFYNEKSFSICLEKTNYTPVVSEDELRLAPQNVALLYARRNGSSGIKTNYTKSEGLLSPLNPESNVKIDE